jgi:hypothetical protein
MAVAVAFSEAEGPQAASSIANRASKLMKNTLRDMGFLLWIRFGGQRTMNDDNMYYESCLPKIRK